MAKNIEIDGKRWIQTPVKMLSQFIELFHYPICVEINDKKHVVIDYDQNEIRERLDKFEDKAVENIYLRDDDLMAFMRDVKEKLEREKIKSGELSPNEIMNETRSINTCYEFMRNSFIQLGLSPESLILAEQINRRSMKVVRDSVNLVELLRTLRGELHPQFMIALLSSSLAICFVDAFSWGSDEIKEKVSLGVLLSKLNWQQRHYEILANGDDYTELKRLPVEMAQKLREAKVFSREVIEIVEQSFENPDGSGFPKGLLASSIGRLPAIGMVASSFIKRLVECDFDYSKKDTILQELNEHYNEGPFKLVMEGVNKKMAA